MVLEARSGRPVRDLDDACDARVNRAQFRLFVALPSGRV